ncbi:hypothetical protein [Altibacter sp. HG106]|uniref:hypothetical protein n=1 Tax=Altibacter sp. HG106 TaxID=3023937 RepID=UPI0023501D17|nr:hypothetical protein [Altibacter sp. HG106]MDC7995798.1 hypothetical protein [Altibacter sp. HG106]
MHKFFNRSTWGPLLFLLVCLHMWVIAQFDIEISRLLRLGTFLLVFSYFILQFGWKQGRLLLVFALLLLRDVSVVFYEVPIMKTIGFLVTIAAYGLLSYMVFKKIRIYVSTSLVFIFSTAIVGLNIFNVLYLSEAIRPGLDNDLQLILFILQGALMMIMALVGYLYHGRIGGKLPLIYLYITLSFVFGDLCGLAAYFFKYQVAFYPERIFYLISLTLLLYYAWIQNSKSVYHWESEGLEEQSLL